LGPLRTAVTWFDLAQQSRYDQCTMSSAGSTPKILQLVLALVVLVAALNIGAGFLVLRRSGPGRAG
jgi:hypothetical protein